MINGQKVRRCVFWGHPVHFEDTLSVFNGVIYVLPRQKFGLGNAHSKERRAQPCIKVEHVRPLAGNNWNELNEIFQHRKHIQGYILIVSFVRNLFVIFIHMELLCHGDIEL